MSHNVIWFKNLSIKDISKVGGKNASLGEMIQHLSKTKVSVPLGFATTADAFRRFLKQDDLQERINRELAKLDNKNLKALAKTGEKIRTWILKTPFQPNFITDVTAAYDLMAKKIGRNFSVAVRSSATAEDLPTASFAGQQETYLNVKGKKNLFVALKKVFASLYTDRAISYRIHNGFEHSKVALSAAVQYMVRSDKASSGVMFSIDTESGFDKVILINSAYGLGETVVQGAVNPDEFCVFKPTLLQNKHAILRKKLGEKAIKAVYKGVSGIKNIKVAPGQRGKYSISDKEIHELARFAVSIHEHYKKPMDIEWAKDGVTGKLYIVQARPETVESQKKHAIINQYKLEEKGDVLIEGQSIGHKIGQGKAKVLKSIAEMGRIQEGDVLVTDMTDPDWEPIMKKASAIVTNRGGKDLSRCNSC